MSVFNNTLRNSYSSSSTRTQQSITQGASSDEGPVVFHLSKEHPTRHRNLFPELSTPSKSPSSPSSGTRRVKPLVPPSSSSSLSSVSGPMPTSSLSVSSSHSVPQTRVALWKQATSFFKQLSTSPSFPKPSSDISEKERLKGLEYKRTESQGLPLGGGIFASSVLKKTEEDTLTLSQEAIEELQDVLGIQDPKEILSIIEPFVSIVGEENADRIPFILREFRHYRVTDVEQVTSLLKQFVSIVGGENARWIPETLQRFSRLDINTPQAFEILRLSFPAYHNNIGRLMDELERISSHPALFSTWEESGFSRVEALSYLLRGISLEDAIVAEHRSKDHILTHLFTELLPPGDPYSGQNLPKGIVDLELEYLFSQPSKAIASSSQGSSSSSSSSSGSSSYSSSGPSSSESSSSSSSSSRPS